MWIFRWKTWIFANKLLKFVHFWIIFLFFLLKFRTRAFQIPPLISNSSSFLENKIHSNRFIFPTCKDDQATPFRLSFAFESPPRMENHPDVVWPDSEFCRNFPPTVEFQPRMAQILKNLRILLTALRSGTQPVSWYGHAYNPAVRRNPAHSGRYANRNISFRIDNLENFLNKTKLTKTKRKNFQAFSDNQTQSQTPNQTCLGYGGWSPPPPNSMVFSIKTEKNRNFRSFWWNFCKFFELRPLSASKMFDDCVVWV